MPAPDSISTGDICPVAYYCPEGTSQPFKCKDGTRNLLENQSECSVCPEGNICRSGETEICDEYHYCNADTIADGYLYG